MSRETLERVLRVGVTSVPTYMQVEKNRNDTILTGVFKDVLDFISRTAKCRFSYTSFYTLGSNTAKRAKMVTTKKVDMVFWPIEPIQAIDPKNIGKYQYTSPLWFFDCVLLTGSPKQFQNTVYNGLLVLGDEIYILLILSCILIAILTTIINYLEKRERRFRGEMFRKVARREFILEPLSYMWDLLANLFAEPHQVLPIKSGSRVMFGTWLMGTFFLVTMFGAVTKSSFTATNYVKIDSVQDLLDHPEIQPKVLKYEIVEEFLKNSYNPAYQELWSRINFRKDSSALRDKIFSVQQFKDISEGKHALIELDERMYVYLNIFILQGWRFKNFYIGKQVLTTVYSACLISPDVEPDIAEGINLAFLQAVESRSFEYIQKQRKYMFEETYWRQPIEESKPLSVQDMSGGMYFWLVGLAFACFVFLAELIWGCVSIACFPRQRKLRFQ